MKLGRKDQEGSDLELCAVIADELSSGCKTAEQRHVALLAASMDYAYPRYKTVLHLDQHSFSGKRVLEVASGPHCGIIGFQECEKYAADPLVGHYKALGYPLDRYGVEFVECKIAQLPFKDDFFDVVVSMHDLGDRKRMNKAIREVARVLKPGGTFLAALCLCDGLASKSPTCSDANQIEEIFADVNMSLVRSEYLCSTCLMTTDRYSVELVKTTDPKGLPHIPPNTDLHPQSTGSGNTYAYWDADVVPLEAVCAKVEELGNTPSMGMVYFTASLANMAILTDRYCLTLDELAQLFDKRGGFLNVLPDGGRLALYPEYQRMLLRYTTPDDLREQFRLMESKTERRISYEDGVVHSDSFPYITALPEYINRTKGYRERVRTCERLFGQFESPGWPAILQRMRDARCNFPEMPYDPQFLEKTIPLHVTLNM